MTKKILLTRSSDDNAYLKQLLIPKGYKCINFSLIEHINLFTTIKVPDKYTDIIITSKRAAQLLKPSIREINAWVVGSAGANILCQKKYNIKYIASSAAELREALPISIYPKAIYLASNFITISMPPEVKMLEIYKVNYKSKMSYEEIEMIKSGVDYILLYSENCAKTLLKLIVKNDLLKYLEKCIVIAISSKVKIIASEYFKETIITSIPSDFFCKEDKQDIKSKL